MYALYFITATRYNGTMAKPRYIVGVDEAGRGPIAGPVSVGVVVMPNSPAILKRLDGVRDSKQLSEKGREAWFEKVKNLHKEGYLNFAASCVGSSHIDLHGIVSAIKRAISRSLLKTSVNPAECLVLLDGLLRAPKRFHYQETVYKGDEIVPIISLASIVAKVHRDRRLRHLAQRYPNYGFERHKGYGTKAHYQAIGRHGICREHRISFLGGIQDICSGTF
jgi:ribonuclease HII